MQVRVLPEPLTGCDDAGLLEIELRVGLTGTTDML